jgi:alkylated DNA repair dioxygenase AlkB
MPKQQDLGKQLDNGLAKVTYQKDFLPSLKARRYLVRLVQEVPWEREYVRGKSARRRVCAYGEPGLSYRYAGGRKQARDWSGSATLQKLRRKVEKATGKSFNFVLLNLYQDGQDRIGYHADDETDLVPNSTIASVSLGAERDFLLKAESAEAKVLTPDTFKKRLGHGSLLLMEGATQKHYKHAVPARAQQTGTRVNATFRQINNAKNNVIQID